MVEEVWVDILGFSGYEVSNLGRIRSWKKGESPIYLSFDRAGRRKEYDACVLFSKELGRKHLIVHKLVYIGFNGIIPDDMQVDHIDHNPRNNRLDNLRLVTHLENQSRRKKYNYQEPTEEEYVNGDFHC